MNRSKSLKNLSDYCSHYITPFEVVLMQRFCRLQKISGLKTFFIIASRLGDGPLWIITACCLFIVDGQQAQTVVLTMYLALILSLGTFMAIKNIFGRPRPFETWSGLTCLMAPPDKFSFPSGHTMTAFSAWGSLAAAIPELSLPYLLIAGTIGLSRVFLGLHYPTDILVGAVLGSGLGFVASLADSLLK